jgi:hypothetical protein
MTQLSLPTKIVRLHRALDKANLPHAFGGALALAWCTHRARGTIDIDLNIFVATDRVPHVIAALPRPVLVGVDDRGQLERDGQTRLWWGTTPVDIFLNTTEFHEQVAQRARVESFAGAAIPFLACTDLAVFKAFFNRTKDWADLEEMAAARSVDLDRVTGVLVRLLGPDDERVTRLLTLKTW